MAETVQIDYETTLDLSGARYTPKQRLFMVEYLKCLNGTEAARRAGYSHRRAHQQAYENLQKPKIRQAIYRALDGRSRIMLIEAGVIDSDEDLPDKHSSGTPET